MREAGLLLGNLWGRVSLSHASPAVILVCLLGCASQPQTVSVPVAVQCVPADTPKPPEVYPDDRLRALSDYELVLRIAAERLELLAWTRQIIPVLEACR
jgi:hypothetical protein